MKGISKNASHVSRRIFPVLTLSQKFDIHQVCLPFFAFIRTRNLSPAARACVFRNPLKSVLLSLIRFYQRNLSPLRPPCCRFIPTCSQYALEAVERYGALKGGWLALRRVLRCQPFHRQSCVEYDPVP